MSKRKAKAKAAPKKASSRPAPAAPKKEIVIGLGTPVVFISPEGPRAAIVHGFAEPGPGLALSIFTDGGVQVKRDVLQGKGEVGTWKPSDV